MAGLVLLIHYPVMAIIHRHKVLFATTRTPGGTPPGMRLPGIASVHLTTPLEADPPPTPGTVGGGPAPSASTTSARMSTALRRAGQADIAEMPLRRVPDIPSTPAGTARRVRASFAPPAARAAPREILRSRLVRAASIILALPARSTPAGIPKKGRAAFHVEAQ